MSLNQFRIFPVTKSTVEFPDFKLYHALKGASGYAQYALEGPFKDRVICTDYSRDILRYKDGDGKMCVDPMMKKLGKWLFRSIDVKNTDCLTDHVSKTTDKMEDPGQFLIEMSQRLLLTKNGKDGERTEMFASVSKHVCAGCFVGKEENC